jgi:curved DNA-binding protein
MQDLYQALGVPRSATAAEIKKGYRKLAKDLHPDRNPGDAKAEERFKAVSYAYDVLSDPKKRALYDEFGEVGLKEGFNPEQYRQYQKWSHQGAGSSGFENAYGGGRTGGAWEFNLEDLFGGGTRGGGDAESWGAGGAGGFADIFGGRGRGRGRARPDIHGSIHVSFEEAVLGVEKELSFAGKTVRTRIPPGVEHESKLRLRKQGPAGEDLVLTVLVGEHDAFRRDGLDLHAELPLTLAEAWNGAKVSVPTPHGPVQLRVPPKTQSGAKLRVRGKGVHKKGHTPGDVIYTILIKLPDQDAALVGEALQAAEAAYTEPVRAMLRW